MERSHVQGRLDTDPPTCPLGAACAVAAVALAAVAPARGGPAIGGTIAFVQGGLYDIYVVEAGSREPAFVWDGPH